MMTKFYGASCELLAISFGLFLVSLLSMVTGWGAKTEGVLVTQGIFPAPLFFGFLTCASMLQLVSLFGEKYGHVVVSLQGAASPLIAYCGVGIALLALSFITVLFQKLVGEDTKPLEVIACGIIVFGLIFGAFVFQTNPFAVIPNALLVIVAFGCGMAGTAFLARSDTSLIVSMVAFASGFWVYLFARTKGVAMFLSEAQP